MNTEKIKSIARSPKVTTTIFIAGGIAIAMGIFHMGVEFGYKRAMFTIRAEENYHGVFQQENPGGKGISGFFSDNPSSVHGVAGKIVSISPSKLIVADRDNTEKTVDITDDTIIKKFHDTVKFESLAVGNNIVAIGSPGETGEIDARLIRIIPPPPQKEFQKQTPLPLIATSTKTN